MEPQLPDLSQAPGFTLKQPWADYIAFGWKRIETRTWLAPKRIIGSPVIITSSARPDPHWRYLVGRARPDLMLYPEFVRASERACKERLGITICAATFLSADSMKPEDVHAALIECDPYRTAWPVGKVTRLEPVPVKGMLGFWKPDAGLVARLTASASQGALPLTAQQ